MKKTRKAVSFLMCLIMLSGILVMGGGNLFGVMDFLSVKTYADDDILGFGINSEKGISYIAGCNPKAVGTIWIPSTYKGYPVTRIDSWAFEGCASVTGVVIPNSITSIGALAFCDSGITDLEIPNSVTSIGTKAFFGCKNLKNVTIGSGLTTMGDSVIANIFEGCTGLANISVDINNPVYSSTGNCIIEKLTKTLVSGCRNSTIPNDGSAKSIANFAFSYGNSPINIFIPSAITDVSSGAFLFNTDIASITVDESNTVYHSRNNCLIDTQNKTLILGCKNSVIPNDGSVTKIGVQSFSSCEDISDITIPNTVTIIEQHAFSGCLGLQSINIPDSVISIGLYAFSGCVGATSLQIGKSVREIRSYAFLNCRNISQITIPDSVDTIRDFAFYGCSNVSKLTIGSGVSFIDQRAFSNLTNLKDVIVRSKVFTVNANAFEECPISDVYYVGSTDDKENIRYGSNNEPFFNATWHYNSSVSDNPDNPLPNISEAYIIKGNSADNQKTYKYKTSVTFTANVPEGGSVQWYIDGKKSGTDSELTVKDSKNSYTVTVVVTDKNGKQTMDEEKVTIKNSLFDKLIWFFVHLFNPGAYDIKQ